MKEIKFFRFVLLFTLLIIQACSSSEFATPTLEQPYPAQEIQTLEQPSPASATPPMTLPSTAEIQAPTPTFEPPEGFKEYHDAIVGVSVFIPENWVVIEVDPGQLSYLQSYPEDKYIGGEPFQPGDTKCDFFIRPSGSTIDKSIQEWKSGPFTTVISEEEIVLRGGQVGYRLEIESMGHSISVFTEINERVVVLACFGDLANFDAIAGTLGVHE